MKSERKITKNIDKNKWNIVFTSIAAAAVLGVIGVSYIRENRLKLFPPVKYKTTQNDFQKWFNALESGDEKSAILYASRIVPDDKPYFLNPDYQQLLLNNGLSSLPLTSKFNHFDYVRWKDAYEIKKITDKAKKDFSDPIPELFRQVLTKKKYNATQDSMSLYEMFQVKISQYKNSPYLSTIDIWQKGYASMEELCRLLSAIGNQMNYDVAIVGIYNKSFKLIHAFCEIRKKDKSYVCDPINHQIWKNSTVAELAKTPSILKDVCSSAIIKALNRRVYRIPAETMDYKLYNQQLSHYLKKSNLKNIPIFGKSPEARIEHYISNYEKKTEKSRFLYWNFPFKSLMSFPGCPEKWQSPMLKKQRMEEKKRDINKSEEKSTDN